MLKSIQKFFKQPEGKEVTQMDKDTTQPNQAAPDMAAQLASALASLAAQANDMKALTELVEEMSANFDTTKAALEAAEADKAALVAEAAKTRLEARTKAVVEAVGTDKAPALLAATDTLGDEQFNAIVSAMAQSFEKEAASPLFKEVGAAAEAAPQEVDPVDKLAKTLAEKFQTK